jgi:TolB-like protein
MTRFARSALFALTLLGAAACTGVDAMSRSAPELASLRSMGYRVAVLPFAVSAPEDGFFAEALAPVGDVLALENSRERPMRAQLGDQMCSDVVAWLQQSDFEVVDPWHVATQLGHAGMLAPEHHTPANLRALARAVGADGVVFGDVRRWNRSYYVVQTVVEVGLRLELHDAASGEVLFATDRTEQVGSGLTGGPTGYVSAVTEPIAGLRGSHLRTLTRSVARHAVADLNGGELGNDVGPTTPRLAVVALATEHEGPFRLGERVEVIAIGTPDCDVRFDVGRLRTAVPARQTERHDDPRGARATYVGHYIVAPGDNAEDLPVTCTVQRGTARRSVAIRYRWAGAVALAGREPAR